MDEIADFWVFAKIGPYNDGFYAPLNEAQFWADIDYTVLNRHQPSLHLIGRNLES